MLVSPLNSERKLKTSKRKISIDDKYYQNENPHSYEVVKGWDPTSACLTVRTVFLAQLCGYREIKEEKPQGDHQRLQNKLDYFRLIKYEL